MSVSVDVKRTPKEETGLKTTKDQFYCTPEEYKWRVTELAKCKKDICYFAENYFTIVNVDLGEHIIRLFPKQRALLKAMAAKQRLVVLSPRQSLKTTTYSIFCVWYTMFFADKKIALFANKERAAVDFLARVKKGYEKLPMWMKIPLSDSQGGAWAMTSVSFSNNSSIVTSTTTPDSGRGLSCNVIICDEFAFIPPNICDEFWASVYPTISSGKSTKAFLFSTLNTLSDKFWQIYSSAIEGVNAEWTAVRVDWWDVPGRDEAWKTRTIAGMNGDVEKFNREFGNTIESATLSTLIPIPVLNKFRKEYDERATLGRTLVLSNGENDFNIKQFIEPNPKRTYTLGVDVSDGVGRDCSVAYVLDVTELGKIRICASFSDNKISTTEFAFIISYLANLYYQPWIAIESLGQGRAVLDLLATVEEFKCDNVVSLDKNGLSGIRPNKQTKLNACLWTRALLTNQTAKHELNSPLLLEQFQHFIKRNGSYAAPKNKHDDHPMAFILGLYPLHLDLLDNCFVPIDYQVSPLGHKIPCTIAPTYNPHGIDPNSEVVYIKNSEADAQDLTLQIADIDFSKSASTKPTYDFPSYEEDEVDDFMYELQTGKKRDRQKTLQLAIEAEHTRERSLQKREAEFAKKDAIRLIPNGLGAVFTSQDLDGT